MSQALVLDSWAYLEILMRYPHQAAVEAAIDAAPQRLTTHQVVAESFNFIVRRSRSTRFARQWLEAVRASTTHILEFTMEELAESIDRTGHEGHLSYTDHSVALAAHRFRTTRIASGDREFRRLGLDPLFAEP